MFGNLFSPSQVLSVIADDIEKQRKYIISRYLMIYNGPKHSIEFLLNDEKEKLPLNEPALADGIKAYVSQHVEDGWELEYAIVAYNRTGDCTLGIHLKNADGEKKEEKLKI